MTSATLRAERFTGHDYGIKTATGLRAPVSTMDIEVYDRPHSSPAMERALQRIETEIPARIREIAARRTVPLPLSTAA